MKIPRNPNVFTFSFKHKRPDKFAIQRLKNSGKKLNSQVRVQTKQLASNKKILKSKQAKFSDSSSRNRPKGAFRGDLPIQRLAYTPDETKKGPVKESQINRKGEMISGKTLTYNNNNIQLKRESSTECNSKNIQQKTNQEYLSENLQSNSNLDMDQEYTKSIDSESLDLKVTFKEFPVLSNVQKEIIKNIRTRNSLLVGAQTGSGKTVGYLIGLMELLKLQETETAANTGVLTSEIGLALHRKLNRPRGIILVPNRELLVQVAQVAKKMAHECKLRVVGIHSKSKRIKDQLSTPLDILIATPSAMTLALHLGIRFSKCSRLIFDEADTLFDSSFIEHTKKIIASAAGLDIPQIMVTATVPSYLKKACVNHKKILMPSLHKTPLTLRQEFIRLGQSITKERMLQEVLKKAVNQTKKVIVFCNTTDSANKVFEFLQSKRYPVQVLHSRIEYKELQNRFQEFQAATDFSILVATDLASRGLDTNAGQIILYDFPTATSDYIARVGRTARFGKNGSAISFVGTHDVKLAAYVRQKVWQKIPIQ